MNTMINNSSKNLEVDNKIDTNFILFSFLIGSALYVAQDFFVNTPPIDTLAEYVMVYPLFVVMMVAVSVWFKRLWNKVVVHIFPIKTIDFWLSLGLLTLLLLFV